MMNTTADASELLNEDPDFPENENGIRRRLDYLGYAPCPVRAELRRRLHRAFTLAADRGAAPAVWYMPAGCHAPNVYEDTWKTTDAAEIPGLISDNGFGDWQRPEFMHRWLGSGVFEAISADAVRAEFREAGLIDPRGEFFAYGAAPEVILVDRERLGSRPMPRTWADVLHPRFARDVITSGEPGDIHESLLFSLHRDHGEAGLEALGANVKDFMHPAEMAKAAGTKNPKGAAIYLLPHFFAKSCPHRAAAQIVWPEEGAYLNPLYILRRKDASPAARLAFDYLTGPEWAAHLASIGLAPGRAGSPPLPGRLRWIGWEYVRSSDIEALRATLNAAFVRGHRS